MKTIGADFIGDSEAGLLRGIKQDTEGAGILDPRLHRGRPATAAFLLDGWFFLSTEYCGTLGHKNGLED